MHVKCPSENNHYCFINNVYFHLIATIVAFEQPIYNADESDGYVQLVLFLGNPPATDITVEVVNSDLLAAGECEITSCMITTY